MEITGPGDKTLKINQTREFSDYNQFHKLGVIATFNGDTLDKGFNENEKKTGSSNI